MIYVISHIIVSGFYIWKMSSSVRTGRRQKQAKSFSTTEKLKKRGLHEKLEEEDLVAMHDAFRDTPWKYMDRRQLRKALSELCKIEYEDEEFETLFLKINQGR